MSIWKAIIWRINYRKRFRQVKKIYSVEELYEFARANNEGRYLDYLLTVWDTQKEIHENVIKALQLNFKAKRVLELGPGYGHFLNIAKEQGAETTFIEYNPYIYRLNLLQGHDGYYGDYLKPDAFLHSLYREDIINNNGGAAFDIIFSRASINADKFNREQKIFETGSVRKRFILRRRWISFEKWLDRLISLSNNGIIIICPSYDQTPEDKQPCQDPDAMATSYFSRILLEKGFRLVDIPGFSDPVFFPFTFVRRE